MNPTDRVGVFLSSFQAKHLQSEARSAISLLVFQVIYLALLTMTIILTLFVDHGKRLLFYVLLLGVLLLVIVVALFFNLRGKFRISTWFTAPCMVLGPWLSILLDPAVLAGDFVPLIYVAMSIQLCSILLRERMTIVIAVIQLAAVITLIFISPALREINWASLVTFIVFTAVIGVLYGFSNKRQMAEIEKQRNQLQQR